MDTNWQRIRSNLVRTLGELDEKRRWVVRCPWCGEAVQGGDLHHWLVKRSCVPRSKQYLINVVPNLCVLHHSCHIEHGNSKEMLRRCLPVMMRALGASKIGEWYVDLWQEHGLSVPKGTPPGRKDVPIYCFAELMWIGARLHGAVLPDTDWQIEAGGDTWDFRVLVAWKWQGHSRRSKKRVSFRRPPEEYMGISASRLEYYLEEGYWATYLAGVASFAVEELL